MAVPTAWLWQWRGSSTPGGGATTAVWGTGPARTRVRPYWWRNWRGTGSWTWRVVVVTHRRWQSLTQVCAIIKPFLCHWINWSGAYCFYAPSLTGPPSSSNRIVRPSVRLSVRNSIPLTNKVQYSKFGWWYSNQTWNVSSSMGFSHFTDITCPWGLGQNVGLRVFHILTLLLPGHPCFTNTCLVFVLSVCLSVVNFNICYNFWIVKDSDSHTFLVVTQAIVSQGTHAFLRIVPFWFSSFNRNAGLTGFRVCIGVWEPGY